MCAGDRISGYKTNHSLRATAATEMFGRGAPEKLIQERTGHRSLQGLRSYERVDEMQHKAASSLLYNIPRKTHSAFDVYKNSTISIQPVSLAPQITLHDLQSCTINLNCMPQAAAPPLYPVQPIPQGHNTTIIETELSHVDM